MSGVHIAKLLRQHTLLYFPTQPTPVIVTKAVPMQSGTITGVRQ